MSPAPTSYRCARCQIEVPIRAGAIPEWFNVSAEGIIALCQECEELEHGEDGFITVRQPPNHPDALFLLGPVLRITPGVAMFVDTERAIGLAHRHQQGDFGLHGRYERVALSEDERRFGSDGVGKLNVLVIDGQRQSRRGEVHSAYEVDSQEIWVITGLPGDTTVMLSSEY